MQRLIGWLKAAYDFISGDAIVLVVVVVAFVLVGLLEAPLSASAHNVIAGVAFLALIMLSLIATLGRERNSARRAQRG
jgi:hypothetical protein